MRVENQTKTQVWEDFSRLCPETPTKNADQEFHLTQNWKRCLNCLLCLVSNVKHRVKVVTLRTDKGSHSKAWPNLFILIRISKAKYQNQKDFKIFFLCLGATNMGQHRGSLLEPGGHHITSPSSPLTHLTPPHTTVLPLPPPPPSPPPSTSFSFPEWAGVRGHDCEVLPPCPPS